MAQTESKQVSWTNWPGKLTKPMVTYRKMFAPGKSYSHLSRTKIISPMVVTIHTECEISFISQIKTWTYICTMSEDICGYTGSGANKIKTKFEVSWTNWHRKLTRLMLNYRKLVEHGNIYNNLSRTKIIGPVVVIISYALTHCGLVRPYGDTLLGQHWLR